MRHVPECVTRLSAAGIQWEDAFALRRIAMTLHRWYELECGDGNDYASWCIARGKKQNGSFEYDDDGAPYLERHYHQGDAKAHYSRIPDRERGAQKRLAKIMQKYPNLFAYLQHDPRGAPLYIIQNREDYNTQNYSRGIAVYK